MVAGGFYVQHLFSIDTAGILMKGETGLNDFTVSVGKYHPYKESKVNVSLIKPFRLMKIPAIIIENRNLLF